MFLFHSCFPFLFPHLYFQPCSQTCELSYVQLYLLQCEEQSQLWSASLSKVEWEKAVTANFVSETPMKQVQRNPTKRGQVACSAHSPPWLFFLNSFFLWATNPFENLIQLTRIHLETIFRNTYTGKKKCAFYLIVLEIDLHIVAKTSMTGNYGFLQL